MAQISKFGAFHGEQSIKAEYVTRLRERLAINDGKLELWDELTDTGIPKWLTCASKYYIGHISSTWSLKFLEAARVGADLDPIKGPFLVFVLRCVREKVVSRYTDVLAAVDRSIALWEHASAQDSDWLKEANAAEAAAMTAAAGADARPPWNAARAAAQAARSATWAQAVAEAIHEASRAAHRAGYGYNSDGFADELLRLMKTK